jgi:hypothetical protein
MPKGIFFGILNTVLKLSFCALVLAVLLTSCKKGVYTRDVINIGEGTEYKPVQMEDGVTIGSIYYSGSFNAFTDLAYYQGRWMVVFRDGSQHVGGRYGTIKVLTSTDAKWWKLDKEIVVDSTDLRDPKLVVDTTSGIIHITYFGIDLTTRGRNTIKNYYSDYEPAKPTLDVNEMSEIWPHNYNYYMWRWTIDHSDAYCFAYRISRYEDTTTNLILLSSQKKFSNRKVVRNLNLLGQPTETTIRFNNERRMYVTVRSDAANLHLGYADLPYERFTWLANDSLPRLASPNFLFYKSYILMTGRDLSDMKFKFYAYNLTTQKIEKVITFIGGYEVGYGGMSFNPANSAELLLSYYSIEHGGLGSNIYLARVDLNTILK